MVLFDVFRRFQFRISILGGSRKGVLELEPHSPVLLTKLLPLRYAGVWWIQHDKNRALSSESLIHILGAGGRIGDHNFDRTLAAAAEPRRRPRKSQ